MPAARADSLGVSPAPASAFLAADPAVERYSQRWALSCEYAATHTALRLLGYDVPEEVMRSLLGSGEDPDVTFRGEIQANQSLDNYGVHARGIQRLVELLKQRGVLPPGFQSNLLYSLDDARLAIAQGQPVVAWIALNLRSSSRVPVRLSTGKVVNLVPAEHAITIRGYNGDAFFVLDPHGGFTPTYAAGPLAGSMGLFDDPALALGVPPAPTSEFFPETGITLDGGFYRSYADLGGRAALGLPLTPELSEPDVTTGEMKQVLYTETARLEWYPDTDSFGLGFVGQELLGDGAAPDPDRRLSPGFARYVQANGGVGRFGYPLADEGQLDPNDPLLPAPRQGVVAQWFQTGLLLWSSGTGVVPGRAGYALAKKRGLIA